MSNGVIIYSIGLCQASACAPADMSGDDVEAEVQRTEPSGTEGGWRLSGDSTFSGGQSNPCACDQDGSRKHWLLLC